MPDVVRPGLASPAAAGLTGGHLHARHGPAEGINSGTGAGYGVSALCFVFVIFVNALELLVGAIQAYVFALLTSLYINDAVHLH